MEVRGNNSKTLYITFCLRLPHVLISIQNTVFLMSMFQ
jgi:hypothetical protein